MATDPQFTATPKLGYASVSTANANRDGTGTIVDAHTVGSNGGRMEKVVIKADGNPADSIVTMFVDRTGSGGYKIYDEFDLGDPAAGSTTVESYRTSRVYGDVLPAGAKIGFAITVAPTAGAVGCFVHAGDF